MDTQKVIIEIPSEALNGVVVNELREVVAEMKRELAELQKKSQPLFYTEEQFAAAVGVSVISVQRLRRDGKLSYTRFCGKIVYTPKHIEENLAALQTSRKGRKR